MMFNKSFFARTCAVVAIAAATHAASAATLTGTYSTGPGGDGNATTPTGAVGPWTLTGDATTFSYLLKSVNETLNFSDLTSLSTQFSVESGDAGGGSPRLRVLLDADSSGGQSAGDKSISIYLGDSPSYTSNLAAYSNFNVIGNNDAGRYDTSAFVGGSPFTTYNSANALIGSLRVLRLGLVTDGFGSFGQVIVVDSIDAAGTPVVPTPAAALAGTALLSSLALFKRTRSSSR